MRPKVNSDWFKISKHFEMLSRLHGNLHGDFTAATFQTIARLYCTYANDILQSTPIQLMKNKCCTIDCILNNSSKTHAH